MKPLFPFFITLFLSFTSFSQYKFKIEFTDKNNSSFAISAPTEFLSQRAVERRKNQNISINENDLPVNQNYIDTILSSGNVQLLNRSKWLNAITINTDDSALINSINTFSFVKNAVQYKNSQLKNSYNKFKNEEISAAVENNFHSDVSGFQTSVYDYGKAANQNTMIGIDYLHTLGYKGKNMLIAVLDAGFINVNTLSAFNHLYETGRIVATRNFVDGGTDVYKNATHGTHVLSAMAANLPGLMVGTAPEASYILLISEDMFSETIIEEFNWVAAAEFADSVGADVINSSLGYTTFDNGINNHSYSDMNGNTAVATIGADIAASKGILVVNSAGNSGSSSWKYIVVPSDGDSVLAVGAVDTNRNYASFSSKGPSADGRIKPDVAAQGQGTIVINPFVPEDVVAGSGTSFSSPVIAGAAACLWQSSKENNNMQVLDAIRKSASQYNMPDSLLGFGIPDFRRAFEILNKRKIPADEKTAVIFPNPFSEMLMVSIFSEKKKPVVIEIFDLLRERLVYYSEKTAEEGLNDFIFYSHEIASKAVYILRITTEDVVIRKKIVKI